MELITTHVGADFDAFASMLLARRFHPEARLFFPGSREPSVRRMIEERGVELDEVRQRDIDPETLERVILCDIRQRSRLGVLTDWLVDHPGIEVLAYDHHPDTEDDVGVSGGRVDSEVGATCTLITEEAQTRGLELSSEEATLALMGIYEDTGSLSYPTAGPRDLRAAAWLIERGADLAAVRRYALHSLDEPHVEILYRMTQELEIHRVCGHRVGVLTLELGRYVPELAPLVSRCLEIFGLPMLFAIFGEGDRVTVIARGQAEGVHLGELLEELLGGGGHATAASAGARGRTGLEIREELLSLLGSRLPPEATAADLMITQFASVAAEDTVAQAKDRMLQARVNAAPVVAEGRSLGAVTRQILDAALQHDLGDRPVTRVMHRELQWVAPETPAEELGPLMAGSNPRFLLVGDEAAEKATGLVTRTTVLRHLHGRLAEVSDTLDQRARELRERRQHVGSLLRRNLPERRLERIRKIAAVAREAGVSVYLVGGFVRDLLLGVENRDLDLVVVGDGPAFARRLATAVSGSVRVHEAFLTAHVEAADGFVVDIATARSEFYRAPAALPEVRGSALRQDLYRRDFTINALAIRLGPEPTLELVDFFGGHRDLREGVLRVLHSLSFIDDPTRVLRAVRLELRLGFSISRETRRLIDVALSEGVFDHLSGARLRDELALLLDHPTGIRALERLAELGVLGAIHPRLRITPERRRSLERSRAAWEWFRLEDLEAPSVRLWFLLLLGLLAELGRDERDELARRLQLLEVDRRLLREYRNRLSRIRRLLDGDGVTRHQVRRAFESLGGEEILLLMASEDVGHRSWVRTYFQELRGVTLGVRGRDLLAAGLTPGPQIGEALDATLDARVDRAISAGEELAFAVHWARGWGRP